MRKNPKFDLKYQYRKTLEVSASISLLLIIALFMVFKRFVVDVNVRGVEALSIKVEDIPITRTVKKVEIPRKPTIPVEDPEADPADIADIPDILGFDEFDAKKPPPPPPEEEEAVPYYKVEQKPELIGGQQAIAEYIRDNDLFPETAAEFNIAGQVMIGFIVSKEGVPTEVKVIQERPKDLGFGEAGVKVMKAMRFTPGVQGDRTVPVEMQQPIVFKFD